jgi:hypothetical protein
MRKIPAPLLVVLLLVALILFGCTRSPSAPSVSQVAVARSNQEAKRLYDIAPFKQEHGQFRTNGTGPVWEALTSSGGHDVTAKVTFDEHGSVVGVDVRMLTHPAMEPITNFNNLPGPEKLPKGIPEVMPQ